MNSTCPSIEDDKHDAIVGGGTLGDALDLVSGDFYVVCELVDRAISSLAFPFIVAVCALLMWTIFRRINLRSNEDGSAELSNTQRLICICTGLAALSLVVYDDDVQKWATVVVEVVMCTTFAGFAFFVVTFLLVHVPSGTRMRVFVICMLVPLAVLPFLVTASSVAMHWCFALPFLFCWVPVVTAWWSVGAMFAMMCFSFALMAMSPDRFSQQDAAAQRKAMIGAIVFPFFGTTWLYESLTGPPWIDWWFTQGLGSWVLWSILIWIGLCILLLRCSWKRCYYYRGARFSTACCFVSSVAMFAAVSKLIIDWIAVGDSSYACRLVFWPLWQVVRYSAEPVRIVAELGVDLTIIQFWRTGHQTRMHATCAMASLLVGEWTLDISPAPVVVVQRLTDLPQQLSDFSSSKISWEVVLPGVLVASAFIGMILGLTCVGFCGSRCFRRFFHMRHVASLPRNLIDSRTIDLLELEREGSTLEDGLFELQHSTRSVSRLQEARERVQWLAQSSKPSYPLTCPLRVQ